MPVEHRLDLLNRFYAPEGRYGLFSERHSGMQYFNSTMSTKLTFVDMLMKEEGYHVLFNVAEQLHISPYAHTGKTPRRSVLFPGNSNSAASFPSCHDYCPASDGYDILVGFNTGDVALLSLQAQLQAGATNIKPVQMLQYGADGPVDASRCTAVCFVPASEGTVFAAAHISGTVIIHIKGKEASSSKSSFPLKALSSSPQRGPATPLYASKEGLYAMAVAPDGKHLATASKDGITRVFDLATAQLSGGFKSYYGGVSCVCWSPDGRYIAAGGEDDLVSIYGMAERGVVAWGEGHSSWVTQVAFDPWQCESGSAEASAVPVRTSSGVLSLTRETTYRVGSVGQDCQLLLWDFIISDDYAGACMDQGMIAGTLGSGPTSTQTPSSAASRGSSSSSSMLDTPALANHKRKGSFGTPTHRHKASNGSRDFNAPDMIVPSVPRAEMVLTTPVVQQRIHSEPLTDLLFSQYAVYTADACGQVRCWQRPPPPRAGDSQQAQQTSAAARSEQEPSRSSQPAADDSQEPADEAVQNNRPSSNAGPVAQAPQERQDDSQKQSYTEPRKPS
ncbi:hypothetical protein ABBQ32_009698 [Trebouxia sp. C0010 RCD-2024]